MMAPVPNGNCPVPEEFGVLDAPERGENTDVGGFPLPCSATPPVNFSVAVTAAVCGGGNWVTAPTNWLPDSCGLVIGFAVASPEKAGGMR